MSEKRPVRNAQSRVQNHVLGSISGPRIGLKDFLQSRLGHHLMSRHHCGDRFSNAHIAELTLAKCLHRHFIGCIEDGRQCPASSPARRARSRPESVRHPVPQNPTGQFPPTRLHSVTGRPRRIRQRVLDRQTHIGRGELCEHRAVDKFHHGMNHALWMHNHLDARHLNIEQPPGLNHFEPLLNSVRNRS